MKEVSRGVSKTANPSALTSPLDLSQFWTSDQFWLGPQTPQWRSVYDCMDSLEESPFKTYVH